MYSTSLQYRRFILNLGPLIIWWGLLTTAAGVFTRVLCFTKWWTSHKCKQHFNILFSLILPLTLYFVLLHLHDLCPFIEFNSPILINILTSCWDGRFRGWRSWSLLLRGLHFQLTWLRFLLLHNDQNLRISMMLEQIKERFSSFFSYWSNFKTYTF